LHLGVARILEGRLAKASAAVTSRSSSRNGPHAAASSGSRRRFGYVGTTIGVPADPGQPRKVGVGLEDCLRCGTPTWAKRPLETAKKSRTIAFMSCSALTVAKRILLPPALRGRHI
jgi:hypothetical protein